MKKILFLIICGTFVAMPVWARTCGKGSTFANIVSLGANALIEGGSDDAQYDPVRQKVYGCGCSGTDGGDAGNRGKIFCENGGTRQCRTASTIASFFSAGIARDHFQGCNQTMCAEWDKYDSSKHELVPNVEGLCWKYKCRVGYFEGGGIVNGKEVAPSIDKCVPCSGMTDTVQGDSCYHIQCDGVAVGTHVIYNKKCMPICDLQTSGAEYDTGDSTFISIKIKRKNAGVLGER